MTFYTTNGQFKAGCAVDEWTKHLKKWLYGVGVEPEPGPKLEGWVRDAGFQNINVRKFPCPVGMWPKDKRLVSGRDGQTNVSTCSVEVCLLIRYNRKKLVRLTSSSFLRIWKAFHCEH